MFHRIRKPLSICMMIALSGLAACASQQKNTEPQGYLATHIFTDGSKQFVYTADLPESVGGGPGGRGSGRPGNLSGQLNGSNQGVSGGVTAGTGNVAGQVSGGSNGGLSGGITAGTGNRSPSGRGGRPMQGKDGMLVDALQKELLKTGFCRKGYKELDRMIEPGQTYLRGECIDRADDHDREQFPNV